MNQIEIPQSFMALFLHQGRLMPGATQAAVTERYELCEDMADMLTEHAQTLLFDLGGTEAEVLTRCRRGLGADAAVLSEKEADWVISRLAELLGWTPPGADGTAQS